MSFHEHGTEDQFTEVRDFYKQKLPKVVKRRGEQTYSDNGKYSLLTAALSEVIKTLHRQLEEMNFFVEILCQTIQPQQTDEYKMKYAPLTNLGCESEICKTGHSNITWWRINIHCNALEIHFCERRIH